jgi:hypothetical protein
VVEPDIQAAGYAKVLGWVSVAVIEPCRCAIVHSRNGRRHGNGSHAINCCGPSGSSRRSFCSIGSSALMPITTSRHVTDMVDVEDTVAVPAAGIFKSDEQYVAAAF